MRCVADILYFVWADQRDKVCFFSTKCKGAVWKVKHSYEVMILLFLSDSAFQKVTKAFLHASITRILPWMYFLQWQQ